MGTLSKAAEAYLAESLLVRDAGWPLSSISLKRVPFRWEERINVLPGNHP